MLKRISYVSRFAVSLTSEELEAIGKRAAENNEKLGLTGILMASGGLFYQVLEGPREAVDQMWETLKADIRHSDLLLLRSDDAVDQRLFPDFSMAAVNLDADTNLRLLPLKALIKAVYEQQRLIGTLSWAIERSIRQELAGDH